MARYLFSLLVCAIGIACTILATGGSAWNYLDLPSFIMVGLFPFLFVSVLFGFRNMAQAFSVPLKKASGKDALIQALHFFKMYGKTTWIAGLIGVFMGAIAMLANLGDLSAIGPNVALAIVSPLYSGIINMVIIIPFTIFIKNHRG